MVSFNCDGCGDVVKKPKLQQHYNRCYAPVTCLDCSMQFNSPNEFKSHNSCVSEAEKYERSVYRGPKHQQQNGGTPQKGQPQQVGTPARAQQAVAPHEATPSKQEMTGNANGKAKGGEEKEQVASDVAAESSSPSKKEKKEKKKKDKKEKKEETGSPVGVDETAANDDAAESDDAEEHLQDDPMQAAAEEEKIIKPLSTSELEAFKKKQRKLGIIYISRIPPGMTPAKVRHILSNFGELGRIYLQDGSKPGEAKKKHGVAHYTEGWVEFTSKKVAKAAAEMLNAQPIGGLAASSSKKSGSGGGSSKMGKSSKRFQDDVWTMKYLKGFKWHMLSEQMAQERASHAARLRTELSQSAYEQKDYLKKVERARVQSDKMERRKRKAEKLGTEVDDLSGMEKSRTFKQRKVVQKDVRDQA
ncbi:hypothetical protein PHSY_005969 [Pseudozyma hubeiensis SY62]|uniref:18S rRNA factor 2 n=1 Tax=Pseudozyma hubeiensis (strain SY62) TaxID=1305764 RepID=R9PJW2_PSEHS|nr:hypothetical protein PHSY_005969 [Pseudozyma hubeiensis SY62]GAC98375.1 hypothetical protein PHSY_005969 [Pseudozyma hubeiensis SY62]